MSEVGHLRYDAEDWQAAMAALTLVDDAGAQR
jgi:hypothetical protein